MRVLLVLSLLIFAVAAQAADAPVLDRTPIEATTAKGEKVRLHPNGRWEFVDARKAEEAKKLAEQYPENQTRPIEAQGGFMGMGRMI
ncbi:MAG TPA: hypothetical protein PLW86_12225, partial [Rhodocyclaceae bacterium]|nr:hypothetical protein [Rhodocyclaceae bacterium]